MCTITENSHRHLEVSAGDRREIARVLLAAAQAAGVDPQNPCELTTTSDGFRVSAAVFAAADLEAAAPAEAVADPLNADQLDDDADAPVSAEVPAPRRKRN